MYLTTTGTTETRPDARPRVALITGGTSGIGRATAELLLDRGHHVALTGHDPETVARARDDLPGALVISADARSVKETERAVSQVRSALGLIDTLFLNAGVNVTRELSQWDEATFDDVFATNTRGQFFTLVHALPHLADGASVVVNVGIGASRGAPGMSVGAGSRGALLAMLPSLAIELAPRGIRVNAVSPGAVETPIWRKAGLSPAAVEATLEHLARSTPLGRAGRPSDIASTVAFLASAEASYITGREVVVAGGLGLGLT
ncbi:SDR family oxidoreductase [Nocardioides litoris]|uniref:SDR family oxidoreductase n=1 Tax=Nocardioides litoris TaxID=1926648 RepID=UPI00111C9ECC|nr:SDR family oxidoreductase [Nocardioides litoris]